MLATKHLIIYGRVQGVFFRASMCREADRLAVTGWVRNRRDGAVEATLHGHAAAVEQLIAWAWRGPAEARVESVEITEGQGTYKKFSALPTE